MHRFDWRWRHRHRIHHDLEWRGNFGNLWSFIRNWLGWGSIFPPVATTNPH
jgi:hypothetical protein